MVKPLDNYVVLCYNTYIRVAAYAERSYTMKNIGNIYILNEEEQLKIHKQVVKLMGRLREDQKTWTSATKHTYDGFFAEQAFKMIFDYELDKNVPCNVRLLRGTDRGYDVVLRPNVTADVKSFLIKNSWSDSWKIDHKVKLNRPKPDVCDAYVFLPILEYEGRFPKYLIMDGWIDSDALRSPEYCYSANIEYYPEGTMIDWFKEPTDCDMYVIPNKALHKIEELWSWADISTDMKKYFYNHDGSIGIYRDF